MAEDVKNTAEYLAVVNRSLDTAFATLSSLLLQQADLAKPLLDGQLAVWRAENARPEFQTLRQFAGWFVEEVDRARPGRSVDAAALRRRLTPNSQ